MSLSHKQRAFIEEYLRCWNATRAVINAGYKVKNRQRASEIGYQLLQKTQVFERIQNRIDEMAMSANEVLVRLAEQARGNLGDFANVQLREDLENHPKAHLIKKITTDVHETATGKIHHKIQIELYDAQAALVHIGKVHGLFTDRVEHDGTLTIPVTIVEVIRPMDDGPLVVE